MVGRRRRGTSSSTESIALDQLRYREESTVLHSISSDLAEPEWPTFELVDAVILSKDGKKLENILDVTLNGPFTIRGRMLIEDDEQRKRLISRVRQPVPIEIFECQRYSIGETPAGEGQDQDNDNADPQPSIPLLWVAGQGGWFEVIPAPAYLQIYRDVCDAIKLFYALYDIYDQADSKFRKAENNVSRDPMSRLSPLFLKYAVKAGSGITVEETEKRFHDAAPFLLSQFLDDMPFWKNTYIFQWLKDSHEENFKKITQIKRHPKAGSAKPQPEKAQTSSVLPNRPRKESVTPAESGNNLRASSRIRSTRSASTALATQDLAPVEATTTVAKATRERTSSKRSLPVPEPQVEIEPELHNHPVQQQFQEPGAGTGQEDAEFELLWEAVEPAVAQIAGSKSGATVSSLSNKLFFSHSFPNYKVGPGSHRIPVEEVLHYNAKALLQRLDQKHHNTELYQWLQQRSKMPFKPVAIDPSKFPFALKPRKHLDKPRQRAGAGTNLADSSLDGGSNGRSESPRAGKGLKTPGRRPLKSSLRLTSSKKRPHDEVESGSDSDDSTNGKKSHFFQDGDESMDEAEGPSPIDEPENAVRITIHADKLPSSTPKGYQGMWTCEENDCDYIVRGGDEEECQARIHEHFEHHEQQSERVQLAITEGNKNRININNLLDKIKRLGEERPRNGTKLEPVKTNLIV